MVKKKTQNEQIRRVKSIECNVYLKQFFRRGRNYLGNETEFFKFGRNRRTVCETEKLDHNVRMNNVIACDRRKNNEMKVSLRDLNM